MTKPNAKAAPAPAPAAAAPAPAAVLSQKDQDRAAQGLPPTGTQYKPTPATEQVRQITADRYKGSEFANASHTITVERGVTVEDVARPLFWAHIAHKLRPYDHIHVRSDDGTIYGELLVTAVGRTFATTYPLHWINLSTTDVSMTEAMRAEMAGFEIKYQGPHLQWCVIRRAVGTAPASVIHEGDANEALAQAWLADHLKAIRPHR